MKSDNCDKIEDKLSTLKYCPDRQSHLVPNQENCKSCKEKPCTHFCPANVYSWDEENNNLVVNYENCVECGACNIACSFQSIKWSYPKAGCGVTFRHG